MALRKTGYAVDLASDGEAGVSRAPSNDYDVLVLDIMLPKRNGLSLLTELRRFAFSAAGKLPCYRGHSSG